MSKIILPHWVWAAGLLTVTALFFRFAMRGYEYMAYTLLFAAALVAVNALAGPGLKRAVFILTALGLVYFCAVEISILKSARTDRDAGRPYLIVLGAAVHGDVPSLSLTHRLEGALAYLEEYPDSVAVVSGGKGQGENISEAQCMHDWLIAHGIEEERIIQEGASASTAQNLQNSFALIRARGDDPDGNVAIVSSSYHLYRAKTMAEMLGVRAAGVAGNPGYPVYMLNCFIREAFGVTHLWVFGV